ncbi:MAG: NADH-quinone oxidoreductase subunit NuoN [Actinomycetes bacterium]|jgi:NADH-quinone oxidoreductase subunit N|nr:NADH-quinone oxidoreductase subunit NuoN [Candidatus Nanopelagicales bacterium]MDP4824620.1 NADH-quinone oxidoreductase subunit NuoN [Candidatus Nanopelagicales bacterium]MDP4888327.1 NADH-quinone oxidoreductase subunit NuoN [Candidatus Nanopelagicales bacterium]
MDDVLIAPDIDYLAVAPMIIVGVTAVVGVLVEAFAPRRPRRGIQLVLTFGALIAAFVVLISQAGTRVITGSLAIDGPSLVLQGLILLIAIVSAMLMAERRVDPAGDAFSPRASALPGSEEERVLSTRGFMQTEVWPLMLFAVVGMMLFTAANDLLVMFIALEIMSLPLYLLAGMSRRRRLLSQEAALKYFILGAFSSAFFIFGAAMLYGFSGTISLPGIADALSANPGQTPLIFIGFGLVVIGLLFKVGAVPFHQWVPDVYQGSPSAVTAFMAAAVKVAAFGALLRFLYVAFGGARWDWQPALWIIAIATMLVGSILAITQTDIKRMLAYSSIAQAGFILVGVIAVNPEGVAAVMFYLAAYGFATLGAFAVISLVRQDGGEATHLSNWAGLGKRSPVLALSMSLFMLSFAGIPLTSGFIGKFTVFEAAILADAVPLVIVGVIASIIAAFFYVRVIVLMFFTEPAEVGPTVVLPSVFTTLVLAISVAVTVILGVFPQPVLDLVEQANVFLR